MSIRVTSGPSRAEYEAAVKSGADFNAANALFAISNTPCVSELTLEDSVPGPAPNAPPKFKLNLYERYKEERRRCALERAAKRRRLEAESVTMMEAESVAEVKAESVAEVKTESVAEVKAEIVAEVEAESVAVVEADSSVVTAEVVTAADTAWRRAGVPPAGENAVEGTTQPTDENVQSDEYDTRRVTIFNISISADLFDEMPLMSPYKATRRVLMEVFSREVLATHSMTGRPSPAFPGRAPKPRLDSAKVRSIIDLVKQRCRTTEKIVRESITTKLADECKMWRARRRRREE